VRVFFAESSGGSSSSSGSDSGKHSNDGSGDGARIVESLLEFKSFSRLKQAALVAAAFGVDQHAGKLLELRHAFNLIDKDGTGRINLSELTHVLRTYDADITPAEAEGVFLALDQGRTGYVNWVEFLGATTHAQKLTAEPHWQHAFELLDVDRSGVITVANLRAVLGRAIDDETQAQMVIAEADLRGNGVVELDEFMALVRRADDLRNEVALTRSTSQLHLTSISQ
jgi:Ca2+-binding EF-hand superfamily protein